MARETTFEIEIKSLLGSRENAEALLRRMKEKDPGVKLLHTLDSQLNHYFMGGELKRLAEGVSHMMDPVSEAELKNLSGAKEYSLRTRSAGGKTLLVLKISRDSASSDNGTRRIELEAPMRVPNIDELDRIVLAAGFQYQAKWSRERSEYQFFDIIVTLDKNAGYGYLAEFEAMVRDPGMIEEARARLKRIMEGLGAEELDQARLERMFKFYNEHWQEYYGTEKIFVVE